MDDKLRHLLKNKLDSYETPVPEHVWEGVTAQTTTASGGLSVLSKWLLTSAAAASIIGASVWYYDSSKHSEVTETAIPASSQAEVDSIPYAKETGTKNPFAPVDAGRPTGTDITEKHNAADTAPNIPSIEIDTPMPSPHIEIETETLQTSNEAKQAGNSRLIPEPSTPKAEGSFTAVAVSSEGLEFFFMPVNPKAESYLWNFGDEEVSNDMSPIHSYAKPGVYDVSLQTTTAEGVQTVSMAVECLPEPLWFIPDIFTPNGDGKNDLFDLTALSKYIEPLELRVFSTSGQVVFSREMTGAWDGTTLQSTPAPEGKYMFKLVARNLRQQTVEKSGFFYLQR